MKEITSRSNPAVTDDAALKEKKFRDRNSLFMFEGKKLFYEAFSSGIEVERVYALADRADECAAHIGSDRVIRVSAPVFDKLSTEKSPEGIICVAKYIDKLHNFNKIYNVDEFSVPHKKTVALCSVRDPGNVGNVIRSAAAFGIEELLLSSDCADIYNPRTVRASMGALFRLHISVCEDFDETVKVFRRAGYDTYAALLDRSALSLSELKISASTLFIVGNEGHGLSESTVAAAGKTVFIPMAHDVESLNAANAAAVFMWEMSKA